MRKLLTKLILKYYVKEIREIVKLSPTDEMTCYLFKTPGDTKRLIQSLLTAQTLWHFEARNEEERLMAKGAANILKIMKEAHEFADEIYDIEHKLESLNQWTKFKKTKRTS
jgi:hypothetical protein